MLVRSKRSIRAICLPLLGWLLFGCQTTPPSTDFDDEEAILQDVERRNMTHRRAIVEVRGGVAFPLDTDMDPGGGFGIKGELEAYKNLYFGIEYDYFHHEVDETIADLQNLFATDPVRAEAKARNADAEQWLEEFDRHDVLFLFDYHIPLGDGWGAYTPIFRVGLGLGAVFIVGDEVDAGTFAENVDARLLVNFVARPNIGINFPVHKNIQIFGEAGADLMPNARLSVDGDLVGRRTRIEDDVNFSTVNLMGGLLFTW